MKIYTKTGDEGETGLFGGPRVAKDDLRIEAYGTVDELSSMLGVVRAGVDLQNSSDIDAVLEAIQNQLFEIGAELATPDPENHGTNLMTESDLKQLEDWIDQYEKELPALTTFVLPAGREGAARLHLARTVCRRTERRMVSLGRHVKLSQYLIPYINRLSDLLFVLARIINKRTGAGDVAWISPRRAQRM